MTYNYEKLNNLKEGSKSLTQYIELHKKTESNTIQFFIAYVNYAFHNYMTELKLDFKYNNWYFEKIGIEDKTPVIFVKFLGNRSFDKDINSKFPVSTYPLNQFEFDITLIEKIHNKFLNKLLKIKKEGSQI